MRSTLESTLPWWIAGPLLGLAIVSLLGLANSGRVAGEAHESQLPVIHGADVV